MTQVWPVLGLAPVPTVVSMIFRPVSVVMAFPCVCAAAGRAAARVAIAIMTRRVTGMCRLFLGEAACGPAIRNNGSEANPDRRGAPLSDAGSSVPSFTAPDATKLLDLLPLRVA